MDFHFLEFSSWQVLTLMLAQINMICKMLNPDKIRNKPKKISEKKTKSFNLINLIADFCNEKVFGILSKKDFYVYSNLTQLI